MMDHLESLIDRWIAGDQRAAEEIYNLHRNRVFRLAYGLLGNQADAEETTQDALTYALINIRSFDPRRSKFTTWLHMITVSRCRDMLRKKRVPTLSLTDFVQKIQAMRSSKFSPEQAVVDKERQITIWEAVGKLSHHLREAIVLRHWGGHTYQEIADIVGCPLRTAQSRVRLAYEQLANTLNEYSNPTLAEEPL